MIFVLILGGLVVLGVFVFLVFGGVLKVEHDQNKAESQAAEILDDAFDGRPNVTYTINLRSLKYDTVVIGAKERGYSLAHQADSPGGVHTLIFEKA